MSTRLMEYIPTPSQAKAQGGAGKYHGAVAQGYDAKREESPKWKIEQRVIENMLDELPSGDWVLDCPTGTGRFIPYCQKRGLIYCGVDISEDMLKLAAQKVTNHHQVQFWVGDVRALPRDSKSVDAALMVRLTRWLTPTDCVAALVELQRVARKTIISTWRVANHPHAKSYDLIKAGLEGWKIHRDEPLRDDALDFRDDDYRIIELRPI